MIRKGCSATIVDDLLEGENIKPLYLSVSLLTTKGSSNLTQTLSLLSIIRRVSPDIIHARIGASPIKMIVAGFLTGKPRSLYITGQKLLFSRRSGKVLGM
jgi:hypothetical protein